MIRALRELLDKRSIVISRSNFPSSGTYAGHWLGNLYLNNLNIYDLKIQNNNKGDNESKWSHLKYNIIGMLNIIFSEFLM